jgi:hypothetical protein
MSAHLDRPDLERKAGKRVSNYERALSDWYVEDRRCVEELLAVESFAGTNWDPACGGGNIPMTFHARGLHCIGTDLVHRGFGRQLDFMSMAATDFACVNNIVCNPPFDIAEEWIELALERAIAKVAVILPLSFLEGKGRKERLFATGRLARLWVSPRRISMPPGSANIPAKGGKKAYAWFIFEKGHTGPYAGGWL